MADQEIRPPFTGGSHNPPDFYTSFSMRFRAFHGLLRERCRDSHHQTLFDPRDQSWIAVSDDLPGCSAGGATPIEALQEFECAVAAWLEALEATGQPILEPTVLQHTGGVG